MLYEKTSYLNPNISYLINTFIYEYDISKANITILYQEGVIDKQTYDRLKSVPRMERQVTIGYILKKKENNDILKQGICNARKALFESNNIQDYEVLSIKNDAIYVIGRPLHNTVFGIVEFTLRNIYTSFYSINNLEIYYAYNADRSEIIDIKGINNNTLELHKNGFLMILKDLCYQCQSFGPQQASALLKLIYEKYINLDFPINIYREFNSLSLYKIYSTLNQGSFGFESIDESYKNIIDISYNENILREMNILFIDMIIR